MVSWRVLNLVVVIGVLLVVGGFVAGENKAKTENNVLKSKDDDKDMEDASAPTAVPSSNLRASTEENEPVEKIIDSVNSSINDGSILDHSLLENEATNDGSVENDDIFFTRHALRQMENTSEDGQEENSSTFVESGTARKNKEMAIEQLKEQYEEAMNIDIAHDHQNNKEHADETDEEGKSNDDITLSHFESVSPFIFEKVEEEQDVDKDNNNGVKTREYNLDVENTTVLTEDVPAEPLALNEVLKSAEEKFDHIHVAAAVSGFDDDFEDDNALDLSKLTSKKRGKSNNDLRSLEVEDDNEDEGWVKEAEQAMLETPQASSEDSNSTRGAAASSLSEDIGDEVIDAFDDDDEILESTGPSEEDDAVQFDVDPYDEDYEVDQNAELEEPLEEHMYEEDETDEGGYEFEDTEIEDEEFDETEYDGVDGHEPSDDDNYNFDDLKNHQFDFGDLCNYLTGSDATLANDEQLEGEQEWRLNHKIKIAMGAGIEFIGKVVKIEMLQENAVEKLESCRNHCVKATDCMAFTVRKEKEPTSDDDKAEKTTTSTMQCLMYREAEGVHNCADATCSSGVLCERVIGTTAESSSGRSDEGS